MVLKGVGLWEPERGLNPNILREIVRMFGTSHEAERYLKLNALDQLKNLGKTIDILKKKSLHV